MATFFDSAYFQRDFETHRGSITLLAEAHLFGDHLVLDELLFYPTRGQETLPIGTKSVFEIIRHLRTLARDEGFTYLTVTFHRTGANHHGRTITFTRSLI